MNAGVRPAKMPRPLPPEMAMGLGNYGSGLSVTVPVMVLHWDCPNEAEMSTKNTTRARSIALAGAVYTEKEIYLTL